MGFVADLLQPKVPVILQSEAPECGIACLAMIASHHGHRTDLSAMRLRLSTSLKGVTLKHIAQIGETMGLTARGVQPRCVGAGRALLRRPWVACEIGEHHRVTKSGPRAPEAPPWACGSSRPALHARASKGRSSDARPARTPDRTTAASGWGR